MRFPDYQLEDFRAICETSPSSLSALLSYTQVELKEPISFEKFEKKVEEILGKGKEVAEALVREILLIRGRLRSKENNSDAISEIKDSIQNAINNSESNWAETHKNNWNNIAPIFFQILELPIIHLMERATNLSYEYPNIWKGGRILTDIRPVFDQTGKTIEAAVISHCFRLRFDTVDSHNELNIAMNINDIVELQKQCERALQKANTSKLLMQDKAGVPTILAGNEENG
jgi:hypothetical protein